MSDGLNYTPPRDSEAFLSYWNTFLPDVKERDNLKQSHLLQLRILCDLCVEYDELHECIELIGRSYESVGRNGTQVKIRPEVQRLAQVVTQIRDYCTSLGIKLVKDTASTKQEEKNEFDY
jgi:hypothetical protein